jgi:hypothetical protein
MRKLFLAAAFAAVMLVPATSASAALEGEYARFKTCPLANPAVEACISAESTGGVFTIGKKSVPVVNQTILRGGLDPAENGNIFGPVAFVAPTDGVILSKTAQPVPGGLLGVTAPTWWPQLLRDLFNETINNGFTGVTATVELVGGASAVNLSLAALATGSGTALGLPVKVKLSNPFLGSNCYVGSNSNPVKINFTTGTTAPPPPNTPIKGNPGLLGSIDNNALAYLKNNKLVDNSFASPGANGCGGLFSFLVDPFVDSILGTPSPAGTNTAILEGTNYIGDAAQLRLK